MCGEWVFEGVESKPSDGISFSRLLADIRREEEVKARKQNPRSSETVDISETVAFETNHRYVTARVADEEQMDAKTFIHMIGHLIGGITTDGVSRTASRSRRTSWWNHFGRARLSVLQRRVPVRALQRLAAADLLVKLVIDGKNSSYAPRMDVTYSDGGEAILRSRSA